MLLSTPLEGASATPTDLDLLTGARAEARSWYPNTRRVYVIGWKHFTSWCIEHRCAGLPAPAADVGRYMEHLVETESLTLATVRLRLAAIAAAHRLGGHEDPTSRPLVKAHVKAPGQGARETPQAGQGSDQGGPVRGEGHGADPTGRQGQASTQGDRIPGCDAGRGGLGAPGGDAGRAAARLRGLGAPLRLHVLRSKTDQTAEGTVLYLAPRPWTPCWPSGPTRR